MISNFIGYQFLHCDAWDRSSSMNPAIDNKVFLDTPCGRKKLYDLIVLELEEDNIEIDEDSLVIVADLIFNDNPCRANDYINYGYINSIEIEG